MITEVKIHTMKKLLHKLIDMQASWKHEDVKNLIAMWEAVIGPASRVDRQEEPTKIAFEIDDLLQAGITLGYLLDTEDPLD